jgi:uridylate kinase
MAADQAGKPRYKRILLKLSGEAFQNKRTREVLDPQLLKALAAQIQGVQKQGVEIAIVVGGGNIFRGVPGQGAGIDRTTGDYMGMLATVINSLALQAALEQRGVQTRVMTAIRHLEKGRVVIFGAGTGNPYFTTDSAAALRASEIGADALLKATKVDGVYTADPAQVPGARRYRRLSYATAIAKRLRVMDTAAFSLCQENNIPIVVFNFFKPDEIRRVLRGEPVGTLVDAGR